MGCVGRVGRVLGVWGMFSGGVWRRGVGACGVCAGRWGEKISLAALLSGYLGKSGHLPMCIFRPSRKGSSI